MKINGAIETVTLTDGVLYQLIDNPIELLEKNLNTVDLRVCNLEKKIKKYKWMNGMRRS